MDWLPLAGAFGLGSVLTSIVTYFLAEHSKQKERNFEKRWQQYRDLLIEFKNLDYRYGDIFHNIPDPSKKNELEKYKMDILQFLDGHKKIGISSFIAFLVSSSENNKKIHKTMSYLSENFHKRTQILDKINSKDYDSKLPFVNEKIKELQREFDENYIILVMLMKKDLKLDK